MFSWTLDLARLVFGSPRARVNADEEGIEVRRGDKTERVRWNEIEEFWGGRGFGRDLFLIIAGERKISFGWPDKGVTAAICMAEVKLPGFPGTWSDIMASEAPIEVVLWQKITRTSSPETTID